MYMFRKHHRALRGWCYSQPLRPSDFLKIPSQVSRAIASSYQFQRMGCACGLAYILHAALPASFMCFGWSLVPRRVRMSICGMHENIFIYCTCHSYYVCMCKVYGIVCIYHIITEYTLHVLQMHYINMPLVMLLLLVPLGGCVPVELVPSKV